MSQTITARRLITAIGEVEFPVLDIAADGTIAGISSDPAALAHETDTLTAAFLDIHTHGAVGVDVMSATPTDLNKIGRFYAQHGVAHYLPTTVTASIDDTLRALERLADACEAAFDGKYNPGAPFMAQPHRDMSGIAQSQPIGIHLEGPFLSHAKRGVHPAALLQPPSVELFDRFWQAARGHIRLMTLAPEPNAVVAAKLGATASMPGAPSSAQVRVSEAEAKVGFSNAAHNLIRHATGLGVRVSLGHSNALAADTLAAIDAGATSATHTFNAMRALDHREPGILGIVLDDDRLYAELICDGIHVAPELVRLWLRSKGAQRAVLVTDSMSATGMPDGHYTLAGLTVTVVGNRAVLMENQDTLAGSVLTLDAAVANLQHFTQTSLAISTRCASHNPAAMLGQSQLTRLAPGDAATFNRFDASSKLIATYIRGAAV